MEIQSAQTPHPEPNTRSGSQQRSVTIHRSVLTQRLDTRDAIVLERRLAADLGLYVVLEREGVDLLAVDLGLSLGVFVC
jgi:hypothetical protein